MRPRHKPIGRYYNTLAEALRAAARNAKRLGRHTYVKHWREGMQFTVFPDGEKIEHK
jgi:hypothetical protein